MNLLHKAAFDLYNICWTLALPCLRWNHRLAEGYNQRALKDGLPGVADVWIQAASVGESFLALKILKNLRVVRPTRILLTANTLQGVEILDRELPRLISSRNPIQATVRYFPFDKPSIMAAAVANIRPRLMVLLETEIWPGLLRVLKKQNCRIMVVNGRMTEKSLRRYQFWPSIWQNLRPDKVLAISPDDADRFGRLFGRNGIEMMPNIKFDRLASNPDHDPAGFEMAEFLPPERDFVILASVRKPEESVVKKIVAKVMKGRPQTVVGLFPRHMHRLQHWQNKLNQIGIQWRLRSESEAAVSPGSVVLWDTFGELLPAYRYASSAFIGGSLASLGGQNFLEALVNGVRPVTGPSWENFAWVGTEIVESGLLRVAQDWTDVADLLLEDLARPPRRRDVITATRAYIKERQGGTAIACRHIADCLEGRHESARGGP